MWLLSLGRLDAVLLNRKYLHGALLALKSSGLAIQGRKMFLAHSSPGYWCSGFCVQCWGASSLDTTQPKEKMQRGLLKGSLPVSSQSWCLGHLFVCVLSQSQGSDQTVKFTDQIWGSAVTALKVGRALNVLPLLLSHPRTSLSFLDVHNFSEISLILCQRTDKGGLMITSELKWESVEAQCPLTFHPEH